MKISVLGSGSFGTALSVLLSGKGFDITLWSYLREEKEQIELFRENKAFLPGIKIPESTSLTCDIKEAVDLSNVILLAVPSFAVRSVCKSLKPFYSKQIIVNVAKGLENDLRLSEVILNEIPSCRLVVLSGPTHAEEVAANLPTTCVAASSSVEDAHFIQEIFMTEHFRVYTSPDIIGVEVSGAVKNTIALCAGILSGLQLGDNAKAALITRGLNEIRRLGIALGAKPYSFAGLSGIGDLIVTCTSLHSRNFKAGILISKGYSIEQVKAEIKMVIEGIGTTIATYNLAKKLKIDMPIVKETYEVLFNNKSPLNAVLSLMTRDKKVESEEIIKWE